MTSLGEKLKALRLQQGLSQRALGEGLVTKSMVSQIEQGKVRPSREVLEQFAERLGVEFEQLLPAKDDDQKRLARYKQAQAFLSLGHDEEALPLLQECLAKPHPVWPLLALQIETASCHHRLGQYEEARALYEQALRLAVREQDAASQEVFLLHVRLGDVAQAFGEHRVALHEWEMAARMLNCHPPPAQGKAFELELAMKLGSVHLRLGQFESAAFFFEEAHRELLGKRGVLRKAADVRLGLGEALYRLKQYRVSEEHLRNALDLYETVRVKKEAARAKLLLGQLMRETGRTGEAERLLADCAVHARETEDAGLFARAACELAEIDRSLGLVEEAEARVRQALGMVPEGKAERGTLCLLLAVLLEERGKQAEALAEAGQAVVFLQAEEQSPELLEAYQLLARLCKQQGDYKQASEWVTKMNEWMAGQMRRTP